MSPFRRKSAVEQVAEAIAADISSGRLVGLLPSIRVLSGRYDLSVPTLHKARALLVERGLLERRGGKRRLSVVSSTSGEVDTPRRVSLVVFWGEDPDMLYSNLTLPLLTVALKLRKHGHASECVNLHGLSPEEVRGRISSALTLHRPTHCILVWGNQQMLRQLHRTKVNLALLGGNFKVPARAVRLGVDFLSLLEDSVRRLKALGHRNFFVPYLRRDGSARQAADSIRGIEGRHGVSIRAHWSQSAPESEAEMTRQMDKGLSAKATAVIFPNWSDYLVAMGYFARRDFSVPRDFSVVVLNNFAAGYRFRPATAHFVCKSEVVRQQVQDWLSGTFVSRADYADKIIATWRSGETAGPAPQASQTR